ncbi:MAG: sulfatase [Bdellovibrionota bacterium]|jgi:choline-sulfatase
MRKFFVAAVVLLFAFTSCTKKAQQDPNILLIVVDTLAAKHLPLYNSEITIESEFLKTISPNSWIFRDSYAASSWTKPSVATILTGLYPRDHGVTKMSSVLADNIKTIPNYLQTKGYQSMSVISSSIINRSSGITKDFQICKNVNKKDQHNTIVGDLVTDEVISFLKARDPKKPFFMFAHYFDPHINYKDHSDIYYTDPNYKGVFSGDVDIVAVRKSSTFTQTDKIQLNALYHEEITFTERALLRLYRYLEDSKLLDNTIIIFTADHGEELLDRGWIGHTRSLYNELMHVPLLIRAKNLSHKVIRGNVSQIDILPTILGLFNESSPLLGIDLIKTKEIPASRSVFAEVSFKSAQKIRNVDKIAIIKKLDKLILDRKTNTYEFYDLSLDPLEENDLINEGSYQTRIELLKKEMMDFSNKVELQTDNDKPQIEFNKKQIRELKSLGYL